MHGVTLLSFYTTLWLNWQLLFDEHLFLYQKVHILAQNSKIRILLFITLPSTVQCGKQSWKTFSNSWKTFSNCVFHTVDSTYEFTVLSARTGVAKCPPYLYKKNLLFSIEFCRRRDSNPGPTGFELLALPTELSERCLKNTDYLGHFIPYNELQCSNDMNGAFSAILSK